MASGFSPSLIHSPRSPQGPYAYRTGIGLMSSAEWSVFFDDFFGPVATNVPNGWSATVIDTGATVVTDTTVGAGHGNGALLFDSDGAAEGAAVYMPKSVQLTSGKKFMMEMRFKTETADDTDVQFGLSDLTATTNPEDLWTTTAANLVSFGVLDGSAVVGMLSDKSNSGTAVQAGTRSLTSGAWHVLAILYDGVNLKGYVDGKLALTWSSAASTIPTGVVLAPFFGFRNGSAATNEGQIDYIRWAIER